MKYVFRMIGKIIAFLLQLIVMSICSTCVIVWHWDLNPVVWKPEPHNAFYQKERHLSDEWDEFIKDYSFIKIN